MPDPLDLEQVVRSIRLDRLAISVSQVLGSAGVPHALLKGPTTANWLYDPPRPYHDVDLLLPASELPRAVAALVRSGTAETVAGLPGEAAEHSRLMRTPDGAELDLHFLLPMMQRGDVWAVLEEHVVPFQLDDRQVPALDEPARCLVLALHALGNLGRGQAGEDLRRARDRASQATWTQAREIARRLGVEPFLDGGLEAVEPGLHAPLSVQVRIYLSGRPYALQLYRLMTSSGDDRRAIRAEIWPSDEFMRHYLGRGPAGRVRLRVARVRRLVLIARHAPEAALTVVRMLLRGNSSHPGTRRRKLQIRRQLPR